MARNHVHRLRSKKRTLPGAPPGSVTLPENALKPKLLLTSFSSNEIDVTEIPDILSAYLLIQEHPQKIHWLDIKGFGDADVFDHLEENFKLHRLELEDVVNVYQRPKVEIYEDHLFLISRMIYFHEELIVNEQVSIFLGNNFLITIQEKYEDVLNPVRQRLQQSKGNIRSSGADYLAYAINDTIIDHYYPILEKAGDDLDNLEERLLQNPSKNELVKLQSLKRQLIILRRAIWPEREKINEVLRNTNSNISEKTKIYFRDSYDHCIQVLDLVESYKEMTASLMDIYLSSLSNRLNQIMKVLAVISTIFIPLGFIASLYGMNFVREHPETGETMVWNMPELYKPYGYITVIAFMFAVVTFQLIIYYRKGWLGGK